LPGTLLRQVWNISSLALVLAFSSALKGSLISTEEPKLLESNSEVMTANVPVLMGYFAQEQFDHLLKSDYALDQWLSRYGENYFANR